MNILKMKTKQINRSGLSYPKSLLSISQNLAGLTLPITIVANIWQLEKIIE